MGERKQISLIEEFQIVYVALLPERGGVKPLTLEVWVKLNDLLPEDSIEWEEITLH